MPDGQHLFEDLLHLHSVIGNSEDLEDLRYRWMLYKSMLKESMSSPVGDNTQFTVADLCHCSFRLLHIASHNSTVCVTVCLTETSLSKCHPRQNKRSHVLINISRNILVLK